MEEIIPGKEKANEGYKSHKLYFVKDVKIQEVTQCSQIRHEIIPI